MFHVTNLEIRTEKPAVGLVGLVGLVGVESYRSQARPYVQIYALRAFFTGHSPFP